jgi:hypothetical protein
MLIYHKKAVNKKGITDRRCPAEAGEEELKI